MWTGFERHRLGAALLLVVVLLIAFAVLRSSPAGGAVVAGLAESQAVEFTPAA